MLLQKKRSTKQIEWPEATRELNKAKKIDPTLLSAFKLKCELEKRPYTTKIKRTYERISK